MPLWELVSGRPPEVDTFERLQGTRRQGGQWNDGVLEAVVQVGRVDWVLSSIPATPFNLPTLGPFSPVVEPLLRGLQTWVDRNPLQFSRVAFGCVLNAAVETLEEGYAQILKRVPSLTLRVGDEFSDLFFQINRPKESTSTPGTVINRLMKWSVGATRGMTLTPSGEMQLDSGLRYACRLELDINTKPSESGFDSASAIPILWEAAGIAEGIAADGELA
jgi:hypothetical protein